MCAPQKVVARIPIQHFWSIRFDQKGNWLEFGLTIRVLGLPQSGRFWQLFGRLFVSQEPVDWFAQKQDCSKAKIKGYNIIKTSLKFEVHAQTFHQSLRHQIKFGHTKLFMANIEPLRNPRWLPNCMTYMAPDAPACGGPPDHLTLRIWMHCGQAWVSCGQHWVTMKSNMAAKLHDLHSGHRSCMWGTTILLHPVSLDNVPVTTTDSLAILSEGGGGGNSMLWKFARIIFSQFSSPPPIFRWFEELGPICELLEKASEIGVSEIKSPIGSLFQKYVCSSFMVKMRIDLGSFGLFWFILGWG